MTSLSTIRLGMLNTTQTTSNPAFSSSSTTLHSPTSPYSPTVTVINHYDDSDESSDDEEHQRNRQRNRRYFGTSRNQSEYDPNASETTLSVSLTNLSNHSNLSIPDRSTDDPRYPDHALLSPNDNHLNRVSSMFRSHSHSDRKSRGKTPSAVGIDHALKLGFLSTLGPGIPVSPTASVFGEGLGGFITSDPSHPGGLFGYTSQEEKRLVRKIDWRLIPILGMFYAVSTLNRVNLLNARMFAFESALHVTAEQYSWVVALFYVGYGLAEIPSNFALLYLTPKVWLPASMFAWGCLTFSLAWAKSLHMLLLGRCLLGVAEAALIPGVLIYISMFYKRSEQTFRLAILQAFSSVAGAVGGLLSRGMGHLDGRFDIYGWQWIFIVEGLITIVLSVLAWFLLTKSPESAPWLNQRETSIAIYRIRNDTKIKVTKHINSQNIIAAIKDRKVYIFMAINMCIAISMVSTTGVYSRAWMGMAKLIKDGHANPAKVPLVNHSIPIIKRAILLPEPIHERLKAGFTSIISQEPTNDARMLAQLLSTPTYVVGAIASFCVAIIADRTQQRGIIMIFLGIAMIAGYMMQLLTLNIYVNYAGVMILTMGQTPITPIVTSWLTTNLGGYAKRVIAIAMFLMASSIGGIIGSQLYQSRDSPRYIKGHLISILLMIVIVLLAILLRYMLKRENNRRNYSISFGINPLKSFSKAELRDLSDKHPAYRYTL
ncbi:hypothetical protein BGZ76_008931 [Entomortierella beljakovae]|nr:hypothetical protein BGZ76_008931 [Entomortierella beljakovae]